MILIPKPNVVLNLGSPLRFPCNEPKHKKPMKVHLLCALFMIMRTLFIIKDIIWVKITDVSNCFSRNHRDK